MVNTLVGAFPELLISFLVLTQKQKCENFQNFKISLHNLKLSHIITLKFL